MRVKLRPFLYFFSGAAVAGAVFFGVAFREPVKGEAMVEVKEEGRLQYKWYPVEMPRNLSFAGERVPLNKWEVKERMDRELLVNYYLHGSTLYILKLSTRYFPLIEERLKANGVPDDFKYLCVAESSLQHLTSPAGASSFWQFLKGTAPRYGLEVNDEVDERYNVKKATDAACLYFKEAYAKFGSWTAAAASFNCGLAGYEDFASFQGSYNYYDIALPEETARYIFRIIALKTLISEASRYGYIIPSGEGYKPYVGRTLMVDTTIKNLSDFAKANNSNYKILKLYNPWLRARKLTVKPGKAYEIELPPVMTQE